MQTSAMTNVARGGGVRRQRNMLPSPVRALVLVSCVASSHALGTDAVMNRIKTAQCALQVNVGRIPGTAMPKEWAASGARLGFSLEVEFCDELPSDYQMTKERLLLGRSQGPAGGQQPAKLRSVEPLNEPTFISTSGQQVIKVTEGAYSCELQNLQSQQYGFRFFLGETSVLNGTILSELGDPNRTLTINFLSLD